MVASPLCFMCNVTVVHKSIKDHDHDIQIFTLCVSGFLQIGTIYFHGNVGKMDWYSVLQFQYQYRRYNNGSSLTSY